VEYRIEKDTLGEVKVPKDAYYGAQTQRAVENFKASTLRLPPSFIKAQAIIKHAAAQSNMAAESLDKNIGQALVNAADEVISGKFDNQFVVDTFQAGAGTSQNMNINEVLANRAEELLGGNPGEYKKVHPNDHANMSQSTNDTIHTAIHIAAYTEFQKQLLPAILKLEKSFDKKAIEFDDIVKSGRTHLQDAVPIRLGQEFYAYAGMIKHAREKIESASDSLLDLGIGGTAVGTGVNTPPKYRQNAVKYINEITGYSFRNAPNMFEAMQSFGAVVELSGALRVLNTALLKIANDLRLLSSGPQTGLAEIKLPAVQPGSSIMPGKVNPVLPEMLNMVCFHALGNDFAILQASQAGQLELNVMMPVIGYNILQEIEILAGGINSFTSRCLEGITADEQRCRYYAERSPALATALNTHIGYVKAAELAKESLKSNKSVMELAISMNIMDIDKLEKILDIRSLTDNPFESDEINE
jgi:aspartate ammonia-lyase